MLKLTQSKEPFWWIYNVTLDSVDNLNANINGGNHRMKGGLFHDKEFQSINKIGDKSFNDYTAIKKSNPSFASADIINNQNHQLINGNFFF